MADIINPQHIATVDDSGVTGDDLVLIRKANPTEPDSGFRFIKISDLATVIADINS